MIRTVSEILSAPIQFDFLVEGFVPRMGVGVLYGETNVGKTAFALDLSVRIAAGLDYHGLETKPTRVLYCIAEGLAGLAPRIRAICEQLDIDPSSLDPYLLFRVVPTDFSLAEVRGEVMADLQERGLSAPGLFVIDTHSTNAPSGFDENSTAHAKEVGDGWRTVARDCEAMVLVIHHSGWNTDRIRGASDLLGTVDVSLKLTRQGETARTITVEKARDFAAPEPLRLALRVQYGGVIIEAATGADAALTPSQRAALSVLAEIDSQNPVKSSTWQRQAGYEKSQYHAIRRELLAGHFIAQSKDGYQITAAGLQVIGHDTTPVTPVALRSDVPERSISTPVVSRSYRNGHRSTGLEPETAEKRSPVGVRSESGPGLESIPWDAYEHEAAA